MAAPVVETISLVNGFKRHIVMAAPFPVTMPSSVQNLTKSSSRRFDGKSRSLDDRDYTKYGFSSCLGITDCRLTQKVIRFSMLLRMGTLNLIFSNEKFKTKF